MTAASLPTVDLLGFPLCTATRGEILEWLWQRLGEKQGTHVVTLNPEMILLGHTGSNAALHAADLYVADGIGVIWAAKRLLGRQIERYPGIDLARDLLERLAVAGGSFFLLGSAPGVAAAAAANLTSALPGLTIAGTRDGYFAPGGDAEVAGQIRQSGADLLLVGMGCPRQEGFITMQRETLGVPVMIGVGGALDVFAGLKRRAPRWVQRCGCEWAWRGLSEPSRLKRQLALPKFAALVFAERRGGHLAHPGRGKSPPPRKENTNDQVL
jgi:N-acetylglucosaminyldiphosphoundecaprenol N-acetyl-beta-D-mannosaminyltransferase